MQALHFLKRRHLKSSSQIKKFASLTTSVVLLASVGLSNSVYAAPEDDLAKFAPLEIPNIMDEPTPDNIVKSDEATEAQLNAPKAPPTPEEIAAEQARIAAEKAKAEEEARRLKAEEEAKEKARLEADAIDKQVSSQEKINAEKTVEHEEATMNFSQMRPEEERIEEWIRSFEGKTVVEVKIVGASEATINEAKAALQSRPGDIFQQDRMMQDRDALYNTGWFYDIFPTFANIPEGVIITYHVLENPVLNSIELSGNTIKTTEELEKKLTVETGKILNTKVLKENLQSMANLYHEEGYILTKINQLDVSREGVLKLVINEGTLEGYSFKGHKKTREYVLRREMRQKIGEPFNAQQARRSMQRIYNLGFFEDVNMKLLPGVEPNAVVLEISVVEKNTGNFVVGFGYSNQDGLIGLVGIGDRNFFGTGDAINITYEFSGDDSDAHGYIFSYRHPWLDSKETGLLFKIYNRTYEYDDYDTNGDEIEEYMRKFSGGEIMLSRPWDEYSTNFITLRHRKDNYVNHEWGLDRSTPAYQKWRDDNFGLTESITFDHVTDTRDNIYNPMTGNRLSLSGEFAGFGGDFDYQKFAIDESHYFKVGHAQVIAAKMVYGHTFGRVPESGQFRIGGQNTLRGYRDEQFRGDNSVYGTLEYRFPIIKKIQGAFFTDFGSTWDEGWWYDKAYLSVGFGIGVQTPIGPIRVDLAHGSQGNRVHFSAGATF